MTHVYKVSGVSCMSCVAKVQNALMIIDGVQKAEVSRDPDRAVVQMHHHITTAELNSSLSKAGNYSLEEISSNMHEVAGQPNDVTAKTYLPLIMIFIYLLGGIVLRQISSGEWNVMNMMTEFMGGFFIVFSFFKLINISGFADAYSSYDIIAIRWRSYGFIYPFIELALGLAFLFGHDMFFVNLATLVVMGVSSIGVIRALLRKSKIQCACLGTVFNLPMTYVTLVEDLPMVVMSAVMVIIEVL
jgi:copper chaperone CopZ